MILICVLISGLLISIVKVSGGQIEIPGYQRLWGYDYDYASGDLTESLFFTEGVRLSDGWETYADVWYNFEMPGPADALTYLEFGVYGVASPSIHGGGDGVDVYVWNVVTEVWDYVGTTGWDEGPYYLTIDPVNHIYPAYPYDCSIRVHAYDIARIPWWESVDDIYDVWYVDASYILNTSWFDESFYEVNCYPFDSDFDGFDDAVEVEMDVDTTYNGTLRVFVYSYFLDPQNNYVCFDYPNWSINHNGVEYGYASLYAPSNSSGGWYNIELYLFDEGNNFEDYWNTSEALYLYPPNMRELTIEVVGLGATDPAPGSLWVPNGTEVIVTAIPDAGNILDFWLLDDIDIGSENPMTVLMETDHVLTANFIEEVGWLEGTVSDFDTGQPIENANVTGVSTEGFFFVVANASGQYRIPLTAGVYNVTAEKLGYINQTVTSIMVMVGVVTTHDFQLHSFDHMDIETCNPDGGKQDYFYLGETVYVRGENYSSSQTFDIYLVVDEETWIDGMMIPERVPGTATTVSSNAEGHITPTVVWEDPQIVGKYDIIVDVNGNGRYDSDDDVLDNNDVEVTAGLVISEFVSILILPTLMITTLILTMVYKRRRAVHSL